MTISSSQLELRLATREEKVMVRNLLSLYIHDLSDFSTDLDINEEGTFEYDGFDMYWEREGLFPYLIRVDGEVVGFVLLNQPPFAPPDRDYYVNELFILRKYRGKGFARAAIRKVFDFHRGSYLVLQLLQNKPAISFWHRLYQAENIPFEETEEEHQGETCLFQRFVVE